MTKAQFARAFKIAESDIDLSDIDDSILHGCALHTFKPVSTTIEVVAKMIRWQARYLDGKGWDQNELQELQHCFKKNVFLLN